MMKFSPSWRPARFLAALSLIIFSLTRSCLAHTTGLSTSDLNFGTNGLKVEVVMAGVDFRLALLQLETVSPFDRNRDGALNADEIAAAIERVRKFAEDCLAVEFDGQPVRPAFERVSLDDKDGVHIELNYPGARPARLRVRAALLAHLPPDHIHFAAVHEADGTSLGNKMLNPNANVLEVACPTGQAKANGKEEAKPEPRITTFPGFFKLGIEHIWTGYDHIMFLVALLLVCRDFKTAVQIVTAFTIAHSITLALATLNLVSVSSRVVEPMIAASIVYVAVENFIKPDDIKDRWRITFLFGLVHGLGFASVLRDLGVASSTTGVTVPLVAFNLGVEFGQVVIASLLLPIFWKLRKWPPFLRWGVPACSGVVAAFGCFWLIQRLFFS